MLSTTNQKRVGGNLKRVKPRLTNQDIVSNFLNQPVSHFAYYRIPPSHTHTEPLRHDIFFADDVKLVCLYVMRNTLITMLMTLASNKIDN